MDVKYRLEIKLFPQTSSLLLSYYFSTYIHTVDIGYKNISSTPNDVLITGFPCTIILLPFSISYNRESDNNNNI